MKQIQSTHVDTTELFARMLLCIRKFVQISLTMKSVFLFFARDNLKNENP